MASSVSINVTLQDLNDDRFLVGLPAVIYICILMFIGTVGNVIVCYIFCFRMRKTTTNCFILTLGVFDLLCCSIGMPTEFIDLRYPYMFPSGLLCKMLRFITFLTNGASSLILMVISIDRYRRVCHPLKVQISPKLARKISALMTFLAAVLTWPTLVIYGIRTTPTPVASMNGSDCSVADNMKSTIYPSLYYFIILGVILLSFVFMLTCYTLIWRQVWRRSHGHIPGENTSPLDDPNQIKRRLHKTRAMGKTNLTVFLVTLLFILSFMPGLSVRIIESIKKFSKTTNPTISSIKKVVLRSYFLSNALNPVIYGFFNDSFRNEVRFIIGKLRKVCCGKEDTKLASVTNSVNMSGRIS
ncbi:C3a anaphylatoxin chemotactic receptor-like [Argonauta hians]